MDDEETQQALESAGVHKLAEMLKREEEALQKTTSANLLEKLKSRDVPYRIRSELRGGVSRWRMLYADARHRTKVDKDGRYRKGRYSANLTIIIIVFNSTICTWRFHLRRD
jgi:hypothetical protein